MPTTRACLLAAEFGIPPAAHCGMSSKHAESTHHAVAAALEAARHLLRLLPHRLHLQAGRRPAGRSLIVTDLLLLAAGIGGRSQPASHPFIAGYLFCIASQAVAGSGSEPGASSTQPAAPATQQKGGGPSPLLLLAQVAARQAAPMGLLAAGAEQLLGGQRRPQVPHQLQCVCHLSLHPRQVAASVGAMVGRGS